MDEEVIYKIKDLVKRFENADGRDRAEEDVQAQFTVPLLKLLGWEDKNIIINTAPRAGAGERPDIVLKDDAGLTVIVIESKAPRRDIANDTTYKEQLFRYARASGKYWGILTNFVRWRVYSVHQKRLWREYGFHDLGAPERVPDMFSEDGLQFIQTLTKKGLCEARGRFDPDPVYYPEQEEIKREFFDSLRKWRAALNSELEKRRTLLEQDEDIALGAQRIIDRLIFAEVCAAKAVVAGDELRGILERTGGYWHALKEEFRQLDELFNTELFAPAWFDRDDVNIDDAVTREVLEGVVAIDFETLSADVIGEVYEDYLGELLRETPRGAWARAAGEIAQRARRRARGIYYTPDYIVDYIVRHTVGEVARAARTVEDLHKIKVLDPACGSGSFLIRAFDELAAAYYRVLAANGQAPLFGFDVKRQILENNLFGVDLDDRAVEICKLNLMIKALEGTRYEHLRGRKLLPNLSLNIRVGNSLVGGEVLGERQGHLATATDAYARNVDRLKERRAAFYATRDDAEKEQLFREILTAERAINIDLDRVLEENYGDALAGEQPFFNYTVAFPEVFAAGGFDAVIGNPPYVRQEALG